MIIWIASYPRSGNTFFRVILNKIFRIKTYSIYDDKGDIGADEATSEAVGHEFLPKGFDIEKARDEKKVYYIKTHETLNSRVDESDKAIYLIRDGREATLSFTKHQNVFANQNKRLIDTIYGNTFIGSWGDHVTSWDPKNRQNTLLIKFEELTKEPVKFIGILSDFLKTIPTGEKIPTFEELKIINPNFFRSGKTNSWENVYTQQEHLSFWCKNYQQMDEYGYDYKKPEEFESIIKNNTLEFEFIRQNNFLINQVLDENKNIQIINIRLNKLLQDLEEKQKVIEQKNQELEKNKKEIEQNNQELEKHKKEIEEKISMINKQTSELKAIYTSKKYKFANNLARKYLLVKGLFKGKL